MFDPINEYLILDRYNACLRGDLSDSSQFTSSQCIYVNAINNNPGILLIKDLNRYYNCGFNPSDSNYCDKIHQCLDQNSLMDGCSD